MISTSVHTCDAMAGLPATLGVPLAKTPARVATMATGGSQKRSLIFDRLRSLMGASGGMAGGPVTPETALSFIAVFAAVNVISTDVAGLPLRVYRKDGRTRTPAPDHPLDAILSDSFDGEAPAQRSRQHGMGHVLTRGNWYSRIERDGAGRVVALRWLDPRETYADRRRQDGHLYYRSGQSTSPPAKILHVAGLGFDGLSGYSPISMAAQNAVRLGLSAEGFGANYFANGATPSGSIELPPEIELDEDASEKFLRSIERQYGGSANAFKILMLEYGAKFKPISLSNEDSQFLASRQFQVVEIARLFRLPPHKIGDFTQSHLSNIEAANLDYLITTLAPWLRAIEQEFTWKLFTPSERAAGFYCKHSMAALLRGDMKSRAEFYTKLRDLGLLSPNDIAEFEDMNPIGPEGDIRLVPGNMVPLARAGSQMGAPVDG